MSRVKVKQEINIYEVNDEEVKGLPRPVLKVDSHWNRDEFIILKFPNGKRVTVDGDDLKKAIENATNTGLV